LVGALILSLCGLSGSGLGGCQNSDYGLEDAAGKGFLNPAEMQRLGHQRLGPLPILDRLSGLDEPNEEFATARSVTADDLRVDSADYLIGKNDLLSVSLTDVQPGVETIKTARVSESGNISLPLIGQIPAAGYTEAQLEKNIAKKYEDAGIVKNAQVSVTVVEARGRTFQVRGAVARPGQYAIVQSDFRLHDAIILAGDVTFPNIEYCYIIRPPAKAAAAATQPSTQPAGEQPHTPVNPGLLEPKPKAEQGLVPAEKTEKAATADAAKPADAAAAGTLEDQTKSLPVFVNGNQQVDAKPAGDATATSGAAAPTDNSSTAAGTGAKPFEFNAPLPEDQSTIIKVPLRHLLNGDLKYNVVIRAQDTIVIPVPEAGEFYMGGHVQRVGVYSLTGRQITLKQAIISAGMLDEVAIPERTEIIRRIGRDHEVFVRVNLVKVFEGKQPDIFLKPYDVVQVGTNALAPFVAAIRNGFRITYGFGFLYDRNYWEGHNGNNNNSGR
jgi:protein involved in polysaccharide export with SLBB domain